MSHLHNLIMYPVPSRCNAQQQQQQINSKQCETNISPEDAAIWNRAVLRKVIMYVPVGCCLLTLYSFQQPLSAAHKYVDCESLFHTEKLQFLVHQLQTGRLDLLSPLTPSIAPQHTATHQRRRIKNHF